MSIEEQAPTPGSVANAYGNALAWKWVPGMPAALKRAHVHTLLYALRSMASASGELRFRDGKPMTIKAIARAAGCDEKDARDRLDASIKAGVVKALGERRRGRSTLYVILAAPHPDWSAAVAYLDGVKAEREEARQRREAERRAAPWTEENGGRSPELEKPENGGPPPELQAVEQKSERGTAPRTRTGDRPPNGSGDRPPYTPGGYPRGSQDGAGVLLPTHVGSAPSDQPESQNPNPNDHTTWHTCPGCNRRIMPDPQRPDRRIHARCETTTATPAERRSA